MANRFIGFMGVLVAVSSPLADMRTLLPTYQPILKKMEISVRINHDLNMRVACYHEGSSSFASLSGKGRIRKNGIFRKSSTPLENSEIIPFVRKNVTPSVKNVFEERLQGSEFVKVSSYQGKSAKVIAPQDHTAQVGAPTSFHLSSSKSFHGGPSSRGGTQKVMKDSEFERQDIQNTLWDDVWSRFNNTMLQIVAANERTTSAVAINDGLSGDLRSCGVSATAIAMSIVTSETTPTTPLMLPLGAAPSVSPSGNGDLSALSLAPISPVSRAVLFTPPLDLFGGELSEIDPDCSAHTIYFSDDELSISSIACGSCSDSDSSYEIADYDPRYLVGKDFSFSRMSTENSFRFQDRRTQQRKSEQRKSSRVIGILDGGAFYEDGLDNTTISEATGDDPLSDDSNDFSEWRDMFSMFTFEKSKDRSFLEDEHKDKAVLLPPRIGLGGGLEKEDDN